MESDAERGADLLRAIIVENRSTFGLLLAILSGQNVLICAKPDEPADIDVAKMIERIKPAIVCAEDLHITDLRPSRSKSKHERRKSRGWSNA